MRRTFIKFSLAALVVAALASPAAAFWTHQFQNVGSMALCTGEPNDPNFAPQCQVLTAWGDEISTTSMGSTCYANICCGAGSSTGFCYTCPASETAKGGIFPGVCWAQSQPGSNYNSNYAWCKSDVYGQWKGDCDGGWR